MSATDVVINFLQKNVKAKNLSIDDDMKKNFVFGKRKSRKKANNKRTKISKGMNRKEKKELGLFHLPRNEFKYKDVLPMNDLWKEYMKEQLGSDECKIPEIYEKQWENFSVTIYKSDFHGAIISVLESKCSTLEGKIGICIMETKNTFKIVSEDDVTRTIPKNGSLFKIHYEDFDIMIYGKMLMKKPAERSVKISKAFQLAEL